jgi:GH24 family phage-related lysozyme (muramidase)
MSGVVNNIGKKIPEKVLLQIKTRSERNSSDYRDTQDLIYMANKTAFVRVVSSVDLEPSEIQRLKSDYSDLIPDSEKDSLAKHFVLFGGTSKYEKIQNKAGYSLRSGIGNDRAYGILGDQEIKKYGYRPMPGITSVTIDTAGRMGSVRYCTVNFKVWDKAQLDIIDLLYFRLGYSMFVEWGQTVYYKALDNQFSNNASKKLYWGEEHCIDPFKKSEGKNWSKEELNIAILREIERSEGNYDAMLGLCTNFNFSLNQEGGYDCSIKIIGLGFLADAIKINQSRILTGIVSTEIAKIVARANKLAQEKFAKDQAINNAQAEASTTASNSGVKPSLDNSGNTEEIQGDLLTYIFRACKVPVPTSFGSISNKTFDQLTETELKSIDYKDKNLFNTAINYFKTRGITPPCIIYPQNSGIRSISGIQTIEDFKRLDYIIDQNRIIVGRLPKPVIYNSLSKNASFSINLDHLNLKVKNQRGNIVPPKTSLIGTNPILDPETPQFDKATGIFRESVKSPYYAEEPLLSTVIGMANGSVLTTKDDKKISISGDIYVIGDKNYTLPETGESSVMNAYKIGTIVLVALTAPISFGASALVAGALIGNAFIVQNDKGDEKIEKLFLQFLDKSNKSVKNTYGKTYEEQNKTISNGGSSGNTETKLYFNVRFDLLEEKTIKLKNLDTKQIENIPVLSRTPFYIRTNDSSFFQNISANAPVSNQVPATTQQSEAAPQPPPEIKTGDIQSEETSKYKSGLELALRGIQLYSINKTTLADGVKKVTRVDLLSKDNKTSMAKAIFTENGVLRKVFNFDDPKKPISIEKALDFKNNRAHAESYISGFSSIPGSNQVLDKLTILATNAKYGFCTQVMSANNVEDLMKAREINYENLFSSYVVPYKVSNSFLGNHKQVSIDNPVYINFGFLLCLINHFCTIYETKSTDEVLTPLVYIDYNTETNLCLSTTEHMSVDPLKFLVPCYASQEYIAKLYDDSLLTTSKKNFKASSGSSSGDPLFDNVKQDLLSAEIHDKSPFKFFKEQEGGNTRAFKGKIMNVLISIDYILEILESFVSADGNSSVYLRSFLEKIISDMNRSMGSFNVYRLAYNDKSNTLYVVDDQLIPEFSNSNGQKLNSPIKTEYDLPLYGKNSIARNLEIKTEVSTKLSNYIAISANSSRESRNSSGQDATSFGYLNDNLTDRYIPIKTDHISTTGSAQTKAAAAAQKNALEQDIKTAQRFNYLMGRIYSGAEEMTPSDASFCVSYYTDALSGVKSTKNKGLQASVMIPVSLNFTTDGISSISMYNSFTVPDEVLPYTYNKRRLGEDMSLNKVAFCIVGQTHRIENNQWITDIRTNMVYTKTEEDYAKDKKKVKLADGTEITEAEFDTLMVSSLKGAFDFTKVIERQLQTYGGAIDTTYTGTKDSILGDTSKYSTYSDWLTIATEVVAKFEGFIETPKNDEGTLRAGYGTDKILINGKLEKVTASTVFTKEVALATLRAELDGPYKATAISNIGGQKYWDSLNNVQKAAIISFVYNTGNAIQPGNLIKSNSPAVVVSQQIRNGPVTGAQSKKLFTALVKRRNDEAKLYLS